MKKRFRLKHAFVLCKRNLIKLTRTPEQLIDVTLQPIIFLTLFLFVFGGAIAHGSRHHYLEFLLPGVIGQTIAMSSISIGQNMNGDIAKGVFDRFRSLPIARSAPLVGEPAPLYHGLPHLTIPSRPPIISLAGRGVRRRSSPLARSQIP